MILRLKKTWIYLSEANFKIQTESRYRHSIDPFWLRQKQLHSMLYVELTPLRWVESDHWCYFFHHKYVWNNLRNIEIDIVRDDRYKSNFVWSFYQVQIVRSMFRGHWLFFLHRSLRCHHHLSRIQSCLATAHTECLHLENKRYLFESTVLHLLFWKIISQSGENLLTHEFKAVWTFALGVRCVVVFFIISLKKMDLI